MKSSTKAALLSAFVFPGIGHMYLKRYVRGILFSSSSAFAIYFIVLSVVKTALAVAERIQGGGVPMDVEAITNFVSQQSRVAGGQSLNIATIALTAFWLIGIVDSYRLGRARDKVDEVPVGRQK